VGDDGPEAGEAEGVLAGDRHDLPGEGAFFGEFEKAEEDKGFVRGGASGAVDFLLEYAIDILPMPNVDD
jgi:hypothetical protein